jgi:hypothetical protein
MPSPEARRNPHGELGEALRTLMDIITYFGKQGKNSIKEYPKLRLRMNN